MTHIRVRELSGPLAVPMLLHVIGFGAVLFVIIPQHLKVGNQVFGLGLAVTAYLFGLRHAFDPDHIAVIDSSTRTLGVTGKRPKTIGLWFALGHSSIVLLLSALVMWATSVASLLFDDESNAHKVLGIVGTSISGGFLILLGLINFAALIDIWRAWQAMRAGRYNEDIFNEMLDKRGFMARVLTPFLGRIAKPWHIFSIGFLFGLGFDTASEIALLVLAGTGAASGASWYATLSLPIVFAAGMSLMDTLDGVFMAEAYDWAFAKPVRKIFYNLSITGLSVAVALVIGGIEVLQVLHQRFDLNWPGIDFIAGMQLDQVGYLVIGMFVVTWIGAYAVWRFGKLDSRWDVRPAQRE